MACTAVCSPCTWTDVIHRDNSSDLLLQRQLTSWCRTCSLLNSDPYEVCPGEGSVPVVDLRGTYFLPISYITRNTYHTPYWLFYCFQRHLMLLFDLLQRYNHEERLSTAQSTSPWQLQHVRVSSIVRMIMRLTLDINALLVKRARFCEDRLLTSSQPTCARVC